MKWKKHKHTHKTLTCEIGDRDCDEEQNKKKGGKTSEND